MRYLACFALWFSFIAYGGESTLYHSPPNRDFRGKKIALNIRPQRIVALIPSLAETVVDLGHGQNLVGAPSYSKLPPDVKKKTKVLGSYVNLSVESVYGLKPDLVLASMDGNSEALVTKLEKLGLNVVTVNTTSLSEIIQSIEIVGVALGEPRHRKTLEMVSYFEKVKSSPPPTKRSVFVQLGWNPITTVSKNTFIDDVLKLAGAINIFSEAPTKYPHPGTEEIIARDPEVILICQLTEEAYEARQQRLFWLRFSNLRAVKSGKVYIIPGDWLTKPNMILMQGLESIKKLL